MDALAAQSNKSRIFKIKSAEQLRDFLRALQKHIDKCFFLEQKWKLQTSFVLAQLMKFNRALFNFLDVEKSHLYSSPELCSLNYWVNLLFEDIDKYCENDCALYFKCLLRECIVTVTEKSQDEVIANLVQELFSIIKKIEHED